MTFAAILLLALGLAADVAAVSATLGLATPQLRMRHVLTVAAVFGGFHVLMPGLGWVLGSHIGPLIQAWDHWIAFGLLVGIGGKLLWESRAARDDDPPAREDPFGLRVMLVLGLAVSVDGLAVGITLPMLGAPVVLSIVTIGITAAVLGVLGLFAGRRFGALLGKRLDVAGGLVLIGLGTKILIEHLGAV